MYIIFIFNPSIFIPNNGKKNMVRYEQKKRNVQNMDAATMTFAGPTLNLIHSKAYTFIHIYLYNIYNIIKLYYNII